MKEFLEDVLIASLLALVAFLVLDAMGLIKVVW